MSTEKEPVEAAVNSSQRSLETRLLKLYLQTLLDIRSLKAQSVHMEPQADALMLSFLGPDASAAPLKKFTIPGTLAAPWLAFLLDRVYFWPDAGDELFATNTNRAKRIMLAPASPMRLLCDFHALRKPGATGTHITFTNIRTDGLKPITESLLLASSDQSALERMLKVKTGIMFVQSSSKPHAIDGAALVLANRPDALYTKHCQSEKAAFEALQAAESHFVVVGLSVDDPVEMIVTFRSLLSAKKEMLALLHARLVGSFVHARVRRVCGGCSRSTPVDPRTLDRLPIQLRPKAKNTYMFGRGCDLCGHSAYRGTIGLSSVLEADDALRALVERGASAQELVKAVYPKGTHSLIEDGLLRIFSGLTSFEEVFAVTTKISAAFAAAVAAADPTDSGAYALPLEGVDMDALLGAEEVQSDNGKRRVMIVEDDYDQRLVLESIFRTEGYDVVAAENGQSALQTLAKDVVDIVICDVMMPVMNGAQFVKQLRATESLKHLPVLMLTAVSNPDAECALLSHGADDYCEKNVKRKILLKRVERLLDRAVAPPKSKNPLNHMLD